MVDDVFERARQRDKQIATRDGHRPLARQWFVHAMLVALWIWAVPAPAAGQQPLPSWNDGPAKTAIIDFVRRVTQLGSS